MLQPYDRALLNSLKGDDCREAILILQNRLKLLNDNRNKLNLTMNDLNLSVRAYNVAKNAGINTVLDILDQGVEVLYRQRGGGIKTVREIVEKAGLGYLAWKRM